MPVYRPRRSDVKPWAPPHQYQMAIDWTHPLARGLIGCYLMMDQATPAAAELVRRHVSGDGAGVLTSSAAWGRSIYGPAMDLKTSPAYLVPIASNTTTYRLKPALPLSFSVKMRPTSFTALNPILYSEWDPSPSRHVGYAFFLDITTGALVAQYADNTGSTSTGYRRKTGASSLTAGAWVDVAASIRGATDMSLYVNGVDDAGSYTGSGGALTYTARSMGMGRTTQAGATSDILAELSHIYIWNRSLTDEEAWLVAKQPYAMFHARQIPRRIFWFDAGSADQTIAPQGVRGALFAGSSLLAAGAVTVIPGGDLASSLASAAAVVTISDITPGGSQVVALAGASVTTPGAVTIDPGGDASPTVAGSSPVSAAAAQTVIPGGGPAAGLAGSSVILTGAVTVIPGGDVTAGLSGASVLTPGAVTVLPGGSLTLTISGSTLVSGAAAQSVVPGGDSVMALPGASVLTPGAVTIAPGGDLTGARAGSSVITVGVLVIVPGGSQAAAAAGSSLLVPGVVTVASGGVFGATMSGATLLSQPSIQTVTIGGVLLTIVTGMVQMTAITEVRPFTGSAIITGPSAIVVITGPGAVVTID